MEKSSKILLIGIIVGMILGVVVGGAAPNVAIEIKFLGDIFLHALFMMVIPLVMTSMIVGVTNLGDVRKIGGIGKRTILYYMATTGLAVLVGLILVNIIQPGKGVTPGEELPDVTWTRKDDRVKIEGATFTRLFNEGYEVRLGDLKNPPATGTVKGKTKQKAVEIQVKSWLGPDGKVVEPPETGKGIFVMLAVSGKVAGKRDNTVLGALQETVLRLLPKNLVQAMVETQVLPIIIFSIVFGMLLTTLGDKSLPMIEWFGTANDVIMKIIHLIMYYAPIGIFALVAGKLGEAGGWEGFMPELTAIGKYALTVFIGLLIHGAIVLPVLLWYFTRRAPLRWFLGMGNPLLTALSTASSSATLPVTIRTVEGAGVSRRSSVFVCPLGATINMDGTALYEAVAAMFIAQVYGIELGPVAQTVIFLTATLAAIGAAGIPEAGLVTMVIVLKAVDLPIEGISLLLVIDWFLDRCRTTVNVWGDTIGAAIIDRLEEKRTAKAAPPATSAAPAA